MHVALVSLERLPYWPSLLLPPACPDSCPGEHCACPETCLCLVRSLEAPLGTRYSYI
jgi:hypothetical protein